MLQPLKSHLWFPEAPLLWREAQTVASARRSHLEERGLSGAFVCGLCPVLFLLSKSSACSYSCQGTFPTPKAWGGGRWGNGLVLKPSVNAQAHPRDLYFQFIKERMQLFTEGFTANTVSLKKWEKIHVNNKTLVTCVIPTIAYITAQQMLFILACNSI